MGKLDEYIKRIWQRKPAMQLRMLPGKSWAGQKNLATSTAK